MNFPMLDNMNMPPQRFAQLFVMKKVRSLQNGIDMFLVYEFKDTMFEKLCLVYLWYFSKVE